MGVSAFCTVFWGVPVRPDQVIEVTQATHRVTTCHPSEINDGDKFCPQCGKTLTTTKTSAKIQQRFTFLAKDLDWIVEGIEGGEYDLDNARLFEEATECNEGQLQFFGPPYWRKDSNELYVGFALLGDQSIDYEDNGRYIPLDITAAQKEREQLEALDLGPVQLYFRGRMG